MIIADEGSPLVAQWSMGHPVPLSITEADEPILCILYACATSAVPKQGQLHRFRARIGHHLVEQIVQAVDQNLEGRIELRVIVALRNKNVESGGKEFWEK